MFWDDSMNPPSPVPTRRKTPYIASIDGTVSSAVPASQALTRKAEPDPDENHVKGESSPCSGCQQPRTEEPSEIALLPQQRRDLADALEHGTGGAQLERNGLPEKSEDRQPERRQDKPRQKGVSVAGGKPVPVDEVACRRRDEEERDAGTRVPEPEKPPPSFNGDRLRDDHAEYDALHPEGQSEQTQDEHDEPQCVLRGYEERNQREQEKLHPHCAPEDQREALDAGPVFDAAC
jgi:hypothetical protein